MDTKLERAEATEAELTRLIEKRARTGDPDAEHELWKESVRRYNAQRREAHRDAWIRYFECLAGSLRAGAREYDERAEKLLRGGHE